MAPTIAYFQALLAEHPGHPVLVYEVAGASVRVFRALARKPKGEEIRFLRPTVWVFHGDHARHASRVCQGSP